jgi:tetratricopeptide (TPR) repeat protein
VVTPVAPPAPVAAPKAAFKMPTFSLPTRKKEEPLPPLPVEQPVPTKATTSSDFWEQNDSPKPISEPAPVVATIKDSKPTKGKNVTDEADTAFTARDYRKAEKLYVRLAAEDPKNPKIYSRLGIIYLEQSNFEDARDAFQQAIKLEPGVATRHFNLALVYMHLGSKAKATSAMELALKYDPSNRKYRKMLDNIMAGRV